MKVSIKRLFAKGDASKLVSKHKNGYTVAALLALPILHSQANASESNDFVKITDPQTKSQLWINPGMVSYHLQ